MKNIFMLQYMKKHYMSSTRRKAESSKRNGCIKKFSKPWLVYSLVKLIAVLCQNKKSKHIIFEKKNCSSKAIW